MRNTLSIENNYNKNLSVIIDIPEKNLKEIIVISHCFTCSKSYKLYNNISNKLVEKGYGVIRYDAMGLGDSEGSFSATSFSTNVEDLLTVYIYISQHYKKPKFLMGHSIGSLVSIKVANLIDSVKGVITIGSPSNFNNLERLFSNYESQLIENDNLLINLAGRDINIGLDYLKNIRNESVDEIIDNFNKSIIMFQSDTDKTVPYEDGLKLFNQIRSNKSFITLNNVDHLAGDKKDSNYIGNILYAWLENFN